MTELQFAYRNWTQTQDADCYILVA